MVNSLKTFALGFLYSAAIVIPLIAPLMILVISGSSGPNQDFQVEVTRDGIQEDYGRFTPRKVFQIGMHIDDLSNIQVREHTFQSRFVLWAKNYFDRSGNDRSEISEDIFRVINAAELNIEPKTIRKIGDDEASNFVSYISYDANGTLKNEYYLAKYPFDKHTLRFIVEPKDLTAEEIFLVPDPHSTLKAATALGLWNVKYFKAYPEINVAKSDFSDPDTIRKGTLWTSIPRVNFEIRVERNILSLIIKQLLPLLLIVVMLYWHFYIRPSRFKGRIEVAFTAFLSVTALHLVASSELPEIPYLTAMDQFFLLSYALILFTMIESVITQTFIPKGVKTEKVAHEHPWIRMRLPVLRVIFPILLTVGWYWIALRALV